jgi:hypothetical protein
MRGSRKGDTLMAMRNREPPDKVTAKVLILNEDRLMTGAGACRK